MHKITVFVLAAVFAVALAEGQYYVPRAYYTIDAEGHESARVPLRRLRRYAPAPLPSYPNRETSAHAEAINNGGGKTIAEAVAVNGGNERGWGNRGWGNKDWGNGGWGNKGWGNEWNRQEDYGASKPLGH